MRPLNLLLAAALILAGCVRGTVLTYWKYDRQADSFVVMEVYANITADGAGLKHIQELWDKRGRIIIDGNPFHLFSKEVFERTSAHTGQWVELGRKGSPRPATTPIDLDAIEIRPGHFFTNEHGAPCYFHQVTIPGRIVDRWLAEMTPEIADELQHLARELSAAPARGQRKPTWNDYRMWIIENAVDVKRSDFSEIDTECTPLDEVSLSRLGRLAKDSLLQLERQQARLLVTMPLSAPDAAEVQTTLRELAIALQKKIEEGDERARTKLDVLNAFEVAALPEHQVRITADIEKLAAILGRGCRKMPSLDPSDQKQHDSTMAGLEKHGISVAKKDHFQTLLGEFGLAPKDASAK